jgi:hypothetical protein
VANASALAGLAVGAGSLRPFGIAAPVKVASITQRFDTVSCVRTDLVSFQRQAALNIASLGVQRRWQPRSSSCLRKPVIWNFDESLPTRK